MATQEEEAARIARIEASLNKIGTETSTLLDLVTQLRNAAGQATPELSAAIDRVEAQAQRVDDLVPDAPTS